MKFRNVFVVGGLFAFVSGCANLPEGFPSRTEHASPGDLFISGSAGVEGGSQFEKPGLKVRKSKRGNMESYVVRGERYHTLDSADGYSARGVASWYGPNFHGRTASNGEVYDMYRLTAAHKTLPLPTYARVTHVENGRSVIVKINDRGPFSGDRIIDLSFAAALRLGMVNDGTGTVDIQALSPDELMALSGPENELDIDFYYLNEDGSEREVVASETIQPVPEEGIEEGISEAAITVAAIDVDDNPITALPITTSVAPAGTTAGVTPKVSDSVTSTDSSLSPVSTTTEKSADGVLLPLDELFPQAASQSDVSDKQIQDALVPALAGANVEGLGVAQGAVQAVPADQDRKGYFIQAGVYADVADADVKPLKNSLMYRVTVGPIVSQQHASDVSGKLSAAGLENFTVNVK